MDRRVGRQQWLQRALFEGYACPATVREQRSAQRRCALLAVCQKSNLVWVELKQVG